MSQHHSAKGELGRFPRTPKPPITNSVAHVLSMEYEKFELQTDSSFQVHAAHRVPFTHLRQSGGPRFRHTKAMHCDGQSEDGVSHKNQRSDWIMAVHSRKPRTVDFQQKIMTSPLPALLEFRTQTSLVI